MKAIKYLIITITLLFSISSLYAQSNAANAGKEFYISFLYNSQDPNTLQIKIVVEQGCYITAQYNQSGVYWNGWNNTFVLPGIYTNNVTYADVINTVTGISNRSLTITSTENICVYAINYNIGTADATCVLPVSTWGTEYRFASGPTTNSAYAVVANESGTTITLHDNSTITLNKNEVYHYFGPYGVDITGMRVAATKPVALFSGSNSTTYFNACPLLGNGSPDLTYEQLWGVDKWGKDFFAFPVLTPNGWGNWGGMLAIVAHENGTNVTLSGGINGGTLVNYTLNAGEKQYVCYLMSGLTRIVSDKHIMVYLVLPDACVMYIPPTDQRIHHALMAPFIPTGPSLINQHGIDLLIPEAYWNQTVIKHDGVVVSNSLYTVNISDDFPDWYHVRGNLENEDITIDVTCPGGFLAYISGNGSAESYAFCAGAGAYNLQNYFTIQEKGTPIDTYYENTTEETHTFETSDTIVVKRTVETPFDYVSWLINDIPYSITENNNVMNTLNFPATALHPGENAITMSVRFTDTTADSLYTGKVWLWTEYDAEFYANDVYYEDLPDTVFCAKNVDFRAEIEGELHPDEGSIKWFIDGTEEESARDLLEWSRNFDTTKDYVIEMLVRFENDVTITRTSILKMKIFWVKMRNIKH